jgi:hypothetical protein
MLKLSIAHILFMICNDSGEITLSKQSESQFLVSLKATERQAFVKKYLQNPLSVRWSTLTKLCQFPLESD